MAVVVSGCNVWRLDNPPTDRDKDLAPKVVLVVAAVVVVVVVELVVFPIKVVLSAGRAPVVLVAVPTDPLEC
jgi:hypothetical protein